MKEFTVKKSFTIRPYKGAEQVKTWNLELTVPEGTTLRDLALAVLAGEVVKTQNGNRSKFDKFPNGYTFKRIFNKPGIQQDAREAVKAELRSRSPEERRAYVESLLSELD